MNDRQRALQLLQRQQQQRLAEALKSWQPYFAQQRQAQAGNKLVLRLTHQ